MWFLSVLAIFSLFQLSVSVSKCCQYGQTLDLKTRNCIDSPNNVLNSRHPNLKFIFHFPKCTESQEKIMLDNGVVLDNDGILHWDDEEFQKDFCVEYVENNLHAVICIDPDQESTITNAIGMIVSMPFLLITLIVYALLPERNLHMKALMFYVFNLLIAYVLLVSIQLSTTQKDQVPCKMLGYFTIFFFLVSFFWMNVICIDIWFTFSGLKGFSGSKKDSENRRFLYYCLYAWGLPILHLILVITINETLPIEKEIQWYHPGVATGQCFLNDGYPFLLYFYGPMGLILCCNIGLFILTAIKIRQAKKDTEMLKKTDSKRHSYENNKQKFNLYLKLLFAMGINWSMELISWAVEYWIKDVPNYIWYLTDFVNAMYGLFIFLLFVFKEKIWKLLKKRYYSFMGRAHLGQTIVTRGSRGMSTSFSTAETGLDDQSSNVNRTSREEYRLTAEH